MKILPLSGVVCIISLFALSTFGDEPSVASSTAFKESSSILGVELKAILVALPVFEKHGMVVDGYRISLTEQNELLTILFDDPERSQGQRGSTERMVSFQVQLRKNDLSIVSSNFVR
jgi:hypothetical protein